MKFVIMLLLLSSTAFAKESIELIGPGVTWHVLDNGAAPYFSNKLSSDGRLIYTPQVGFRKIHTDNQFVYSSFAAFMGSNSIGSPIYGFVGSTGVELLRILHIGIAIGTYIQNNNDFNAKGLEPFSMTSGTNALVPILGFEINTQIPISDRMFIGFNNLITPVITNHNLSIGLGY